MRDSATRRRRRVSYARGLAACLLPLLCTGCWKPPQPLAAQSARGLIWLLPGIEGGAWEMQMAHAALRDAGVQAEIRVFDWHRPFGDLDNLMNYEKNRRRADDLAGRFAEYHAAHPAAPMDLVGYSGGGGLAVMIAEALPTNVRLRNLVLVQPALSPCYDLSAALAHVDGKLVNFYCPTDWLVLGLGTSVFGTMDRVKVASAGKARFDLEHAVSDPASRDKVEQRGWNLSMVRRGHLGGHPDAFGYFWNRTYVAPYLLPAEEAKGAGDSRAE